MKKMNSLFLCLGLCFVSLCPDQGHESFSTHSPALSSLEVSQELIQKELYACPRCRRAAPKGPRKLPAPPIPPAQTHYQAEFC